VFISGEVVGGYSEGPKSNKVQLARDLSEGAKKRPPKLRGNGRNPNARKAESIRATKKGKSSRQSLKWRI